MTALGITSNLAAFNIAFKRYAATWTDRGHGTINDVLEKKGKDMGIRLYKGFAARKWGGQGKHPGLARAELDERAASGIGIKLRKSLKDEYESQRGELRLKLRGKHGLGAIKRKVALWQKFVGRELRLRQGGIGYLATSFLWTRKRTSQAAGTFFVQNKRGKYVGEVVKGDDFFRIIADAAGSATVSERYGIVSAALADSAADMEKYTMEREREQFKKAFAGFGA